MVTGLDVKFQAIRLANCKAETSVYPSRTYPSARENHRSSLTSISPPAPCRDTRSAGWHREVFQLGMPIVPTPASNEVVAETLSFFPVHIVCRQSVDIVGRVDGGHRTRKIWVRRGIQQTKSIQDGQ